jgi:predicted secreted protein
MTGADYPEVAGRVGLGVRLFVLSGIIVFIALFFTECLEPSFGQDCEGIAAEKGQVVLDEEFSGVARISTNQRFYVRLKALPAAGFSWDLEDRTDDRVRLLCDKVEENHSTPPGVGGQTNWQVFTFEAIRVGTAELKFVYHHPWLLPTAEDRRISFTLGVHEQK